jgi:hypothetical protein
MRLLIACCRGVHPRCRWNDKAAYSPLPDLRDASKPNSASTGRSDVVDCEPQRQDRGLNRRADMRFWFQLHLDPPSHLPWRFVLRYLPEAPELFFPHGGRADGDTPVRESGRQTAQPRLVPGNRHPAGAHRSAGPGPSDAPERRNCLIRAHLQSSEIS